MDGWISDGWMNTWMDRWLDAWLAAFSLAIHQLMALGFRLGSISTRQVKRIFSLFPSEIFPSPY